MTAVDLDALDAARAAALAEAAGCHRLTDSDGDAEWCETHGGDWPCKGAALLPVVQALVAEGKAAELRAAAASITGSASVQLRPWECAELLNARADALTAGSEAGT